MRAFRLVGAACLAAFFAAASVTVVPGIAVAAERFVVIGCVSRDAQRQFILTDTRSDPPAVYRLTGSDDTTLTFHVGHTLEIAGEISVGPPKAIAIESLIYIATTCVKLHPPNPN